MRRGAGHVQCLTGKVGFSEKIAPLLVSNMRCTTREDRESLSEAQVDDKIILGLARAGVEEFKTNPAQPGPMGRRHMTMCRLL